jgi:hypothetical protein
MPEYFVITISFPAPVCGDQSEKYVQADNPIDAWQKAEKSYSHPFGLFSVQVFKSADDYHKKNTPEVYWITDKAKLWIKKKGYKLSDFGYKET